ncbi:MAG: ATPase, partial [Peptostreptococcaceae bacterium]
MAKLGIDIGNYNVKTSEGIIFKSAISNSIEFGNDYDKLVYNDETFYLGNGRLEIDYRKFDKENYMPLLLGA